jgi:multicopper oxidase
VASENFSDVSRRQFLLHSARAGVATIGAASVILPGITILPIALAAGDWPVEGSSAADAGVAEYSVQVVSKQAAPDGRMREVMCYDGQIPGAVIRAKEGQKFRIKVANKLRVPTSIHWHGMHQPGTWQMDGVADVSRPPIPPGEDYTYEFTATPAGTHWYHSHTGVQYSDGLFGPLIVDERTLPAKYDREGILLVNDWFLQQSEAILAGLVKPARKNPAAMDSMKAESGGKSGDSKPAMDESKAVKAGMAMGGKPDIADVPFQSGLINGHGRFGEASTPELPSIQVKPGEVLRLRLISGASTYQFRFQIDGHPMTVIASDGAPMKPVEVDSILLSPGERYDVLLKATGEKSAWIRAVTLDGNEVKAMLLYPDGAPGELPSGPVKWGERELVPEQMESPSPVALDAKPQEVKLTIGGTMSPYAWNINGQEYPQADPIKLAANQSVRFLMENPTMMDHPFHLHGHYFYVLGEPDKLNLADPVKKDTVNIPAGKTLVVQWTTNNPGHWFYHCHIEWHLATGMARVIEIA